MEPSEVSSAFLGKALLPPRPQNNTESGLKMEIIYAYSTDLLACLTLVAKYRNVQILVYFVAKHFVRELGVEVAS